MIFIWCTAAKIAMVCTIIALILAGIMIIVSAFDCTLVEEMSGMFGIAAICCIIMLAIGFRPTNMVISDYKILKATEDHCTFTLEHLDEYTYTYEYERQMDEVKYTDELIKTRKKLKTYEKALSKKMKKIKKKAIPQLVDSQSLKASKFLEQVTVEDY